MKLVLQHVDIAGAARNAVVQPVEQQWSPVFYIADDQPLPPGRYGVIEFEDFDKDGLPKFTKDALPKTRRFEVEQPEVQAPTVSKKTKPFDVPQPTGG